MEIIFNVSDLDITYARPENHVINDSINYIEAIFNFNGEIWSKSNVQKTVIFKSNNLAYSIILDGDRCYIPFEVLKSSAFSVGVMANYSENDIETTVYTRSCIVRTYSSCCADSFDNRLTPTQYEQIMEIISKGFKTIIYESDEVAKIDGYTIKDSVARAKLDNKVDKEYGKSLSSNDYTDEEKEKLSVIPYNAEENVIDKIVVNSVEQTIEDKTVNIKVPVSTSDLEDGENLATKDDLVSKVDKEPSKGLSTNDYSNEEKQKLAGTENGAQINKIETVSVNGTELPITDKTVNIPVPKNTSDLVNDNQFVNLAMLNEAQSYKVDKVEGKGLSSNDFTDDDKLKLASLKNYDDTEIKQSVDNKLNKNQGAALAGSFMVVDSNGDIVPMQISVWQGGSY